MIDLGCVPILIALGRSNPLESSKQDCARALSNLSCETGTEVTIVKQGAAGGLVMMALFRSDSVGTKELCVYALFNLLCDPTSRVGLMREEVRVAVEVNCRGGGVGGGVHSMAYCLLTRGSSIFHKKHR
jgi:hypothetical protein